MTDIKSCEKRYKLLDALPIALLLLSTFLMLTHSRELAAFAKSGMLIAVGSVIPSTFPFLILSDFLSAFPITKGRLAKLFSRVTGFSECSFSAFLIGNTCGCPSGVSSAIGLYNAHCISRDECERLVGVTNIPSLSFVISFVGLSLKNSAKFGFKMYLCLLLSSVLISIFKKSNTQKISNVTEISRQKFNIVTSIKSAGLNSLSITSYIVFFSVCVGMLNLMIKSDIVSLIISSFLEVGGTISAIASSSVKNQILLDSILGFSLGFSGLCIHCQAITLFPKELSAKKYILHKLIQGITCAILFPIALSF